MDKILIKGGKSLKGNVKISGSKNSALPILAATILTDEQCVIKNVPPLKDISTICSILKALNIETERKGNSIVVTPGKEKKYITPYNLVKKMRASICVLGPLVAKLNKAQVSLPGGCVIGPRPIDLHLKGLRALGADIKVKHGYVNANCNGLKGNKIYLGGPFGSSVLGTGNVMMAATLADGKTIIDNAASEPEIVDLAGFLKQMGAEIEGIGTKRIKIKGKNKLHGTEYGVIPDRIEASTYMVAGAITGGEVRVTKCLPEHSESVIAKLRRCNVDVEVDKNEIFVLGDKNYIKSTEITTYPYPGFPTDVQAQMMSLMSIADGVSVITEKVFPKRFLHVGELNRMGADITLEGNHAIVKGVPELSGAPVMASDLRASAALILAGLVAKGETLISRIYHLDRGYYNLEEKLSNLGAEIERIR